MTNDILAKLARWAQQNPHAVAGDHAGEELLELVRSIRGAGNAEYDTMLATGVVPDSLKHRFRSTAEGLPVTNGQSGDAA